MIDGAEDSEAGELAETRLRRIGSVNDLVGFAANINFHGRGDSVALNNALKKTMDGVRVMLGRPPALLEVKDAYFLPAFNCLYDDGGRRIEESCMHRRRLGASELMDAGPETISLPLDAPILREPLLYAARISTHWGHFLTEGIGRLWARGTAAELQRLPCFTVVDDRHPQTMRDYLDTLGIRRDRLRHASVATRLETCFVPGASFSSNAEAYAAHLEPSQEVASKLCPRPRGVPSSQPVYLSRSQLSLVRKIRGELELECALAGLGVRIVHPEQLSLAEQIALLQSSSVFIGCWGSAFHGLSLAIRPERITTHVICPGMPSANYLMLDAILGYEANYVQAMCETPGSARTFRNGEFTVDVNAVVGHLRDVGCVSGPASAKLIAQRPCAVDRSYDALTRIAGKVIESAPSLPESMTRSLRNPTLQSLEIVGAELIGAGNLDVAETMFRAFVDWPGLPPIAAVGLARVAMARGDANSASSAWRSILERYPEYAVPGWYLDWAQSERQRGDDENAVAALRRCRELFPGVPQSLILEADIHKSLGRYEECAAAWGNAIREFPTEVKPWWYLQQAEALRSSGHGAGAVAPVLTACRQRFPSFAQASAALAQVLGQLGRHEECADAWESALRDSTEAPPCAWYIGCALTLRHLGRNERAEFILRSCCERFPQESGCVTLLATVLHKQGRYRESADVWESALRNFQQFAQAWWYTSFASSLRALGLRERARQMLAERAREFSEAGRDGS